MRANSSRIVQLDALRGIAVLMVMGFHPAVHYSFAGVMKPLAYAWQAYGWIGVELFFVLSGYLIGGLLLAELKARGSINIRRFIIRRGFKIWPAYLVFVVFVTGWYLIRGGEQYRRPVLYAMAPNFLHLQNYVPTLAVHTWTLAIEEHFYLLLPFALLLIARPLSARRAVLWLIGTAAIIFTLITLTRWLVLRLAVPAELAGYYAPYNRAGFMNLIGAQLFLFVALVLAARLFRWRLQVVIGVILVLTLAFRVATVMLEPKYAIDPSLPVYATHLRLDALLFGVLLAYRRPKAHWWYWIVGALVITVVAFWPSDHWFAHYLVNRTALYVACGAILVAALGTGASWITYALARIGVYSYSIYLWHLNPMRFWISDAVDARLHLGAGARWLVLTAVYVALTLLCGIVLSKLIEWPLLRLRDRWFPSELPTAKP